MVTVCEGNARRRGRALASFQQALQQAFAGVPLVEGDLFGGVAAGLVVDLSGR